jgi:ABC-2 type transport system ATP-binding protein
MSLLEARQLTKRFGRVTALSGLDLRAESGQILALLGPNGAGKTTFIRLLGTLLRPDSGSLRIAGTDVIRDPRAARRLIGLAGQHAAIEPAMTGRENLRMVARLYGRTGAQASRAADLVLGRLGLATVGDQLVRAYSGGMRRRLDLGASLVGRPRVLLLDEPTTGLDPRSRIELWDMIRDLAAAGTDIVLTTQYLDEADRLAARIVIIDHGRVIADGTPAQLKASSGADVIVAHTADNASADACATILGRLAGSQPRADHATHACSVPAPEGLQTLRSAIDALTAAGVPVDDIALRRPSLDEVFLALTGGQP